MRTPEETPPVTGHGQAERSNCPRRILVDCTQTLATSRHSGIPRVVRNIIRYGGAAAALHGATIVPIRFEDGHFQVVGLSPHGIILDVDEHVPASFSHPVLRRLRILVPTTVVRFVRAQWRRLRAIPLRGQPAVFGPDDTLLLADSSWSAKYWRLVDAAQAAGARLGVVQYDFIPHTHPEFVTKRLANAFRGWMRNTLKRADFVAAISEAVAIEARVELRRMGRDPERASPFVQSFRLGSDVKPVSETGAVRAELKEFLAAAADGPYLTVGTIEPRKNQMILPAVFEEVWKTVPQARLLVAGFVGWKGDELIRRMRQHPRYGTHLMHFGDLNDLEIDHAYSHARALIFPSLAEGFGLPIVESLSHGIRVFASDIPVHREVGGAWCSYFAPSDVAGFAGQIVRWERDGDFEKTPPEGAFSSPTWQQAVEQLMGIACGVASTEPRTRPKRAAA